MTTRTAHVAFLETFNFIKEGKRDHDHAVPFNPEWDNGTGYYNGACTDNLNLPIGSRFCATSLNDRKIIGVVTPVGNAVFFERYTGGENGVIVTNKPRCLSSLWYDGSQTAETIDRIMGAPRGFNENIGATLRGIVLEVVTNAEQMNALKAQAKGCVVTVIED